MDIKVKGRTLSDRPLALGVQGDNNVEELRFLVPRYTDAGVDLSLGIGYAVFRLPDGTDGHVSLTPEVMDTDENTVSLTLLVGSQMTEQKGSGKLCLKVAGLEAALWSSTICDMFVNSTIAMPSPQPVSLFRTMSVGPKLAEDESEPPLTVTERTINIPAELQTIAVAQDENSETVKIVVPRYFDGQDLSVHDFILHTQMGTNGTDDILFNNQNGQMKSVSGSTVTLTWVLRPPQTSYEGKLSIQLLVQGDEFKWHSLIGELTIAKHITGDPVVPATPSMHEQWLAEVKEQADYVRSQAANIQTVVDEMDAIKDAPAAADRAEQAAKDAEKAAAESKGFRTFHSAVVPDANGNLDPSRPMTVGPAASVEIESEGDRIQSVTALGFTQQAGTGDPSPENVRALTNGGLKLVKMVQTGSENWRLDSSGNFYLAPNVTPKSAEVGDVYSNFYKGLVRIGFSGDFVCTTSAQNILIRDSRFANESQLKQHLASLYAAGNPVIIWYAPADESQATGLYAPIILTSGEYRATCLSLTAPLCEGDSVVSYIESGRDMELTVDGSDDEAWDTVSSGANMLFRLRGALVGNSGNANTIISNLYVFASISSGNTAEGVGGYDTALYVRDSKYADLDEFKAALAARPLTVWYRSTNYTPAADIPVSLETHVQAVLVLDGTEGWATAVAGAYYMFPSNSPKASSATSTTSAVSDYLTAAPTNDIAAGTEGFGIGPSGSIAVRLPNGATPSAYMPDKPLTIVYQLATPITYAHEAVVLEAATGEQLTYTVTGQSGGTVSVALKPFQDGGHAATADNATNAVTAQTAANSQQLGGLTLSALQDLLVPVGYIFSWAPVDDGPDLSTAQKVAEYFGFGTWKEYGAGQVLVGVDSGQTEFATVGKTGGEKTHMLTVSELASHRHAYAVDTSVTYTGTPGFDMFKVADSGSSNTGETGGNQPHNNLQPYITVYRWQRIA